MLPKLKLRSKLLFLFFIGFSLSFLAAGIFWINLVNKETSSFQAMPYAAVLLFLLVILVFFGLSVLLSRQILRPLELLKQWSDYVGLGNLNERLKIKTGDEIEELSNSFNLMASSMEDAIRGLEKSREEILIEKNKLATVIYSIADGVIAIDSKYNIILFNKAAEALTGFTEVEVSGRPVGDILKVFKENQEITVNQYCPISAPNARGVLFEDKGLQIHGKDEKKWYVDLAVGTIHNENASLGCILTLRDVTKEKELEAMKLDFVTMTAHELRTPLTAIKGYLAILKEPEKLKEGEQEEYLNKLSKSTERLGGLVENVLNIARIEQGGLALNLESVKLPGLVQEMVSEIEGQAKEKQISVTFDKPTDLLPEVKADKLRISQVVLNLLSNAVHYTNSGGKIRVWIERSGDSLIAHVLDTGVGIPEHSIPHLFTKFYRVPSTSLIQQDKGNGLGLYITKSIIDMHKGKVWVESEVGKGSTFSFSLPIFTSQENVPNTVTTTH